MIKSETNFATMKNRIIGIVALVLFTTLTGTDVPARGFFFNLFNYHPYHRHYHKLFLPHYRIVNHYIIEKIPVPVPSASSHRDDPAILNEEQRDKLRQIKENLDKLNQDLKEKSLEELRLRQLPNY